MKRILTRLGLGTVLWAIAYAGSIPLLPLMQSSPMVFKALMVCIGAVASSLLAVYYFSGIERNFLREALLLSGTWLVVNWFLDFVALLPFSNQTLGQYFAEIGIEYVGLMAPIIAMGYILGKKIEKGGVSGGAL